MNLRRITTRTAVAGVTTAVAATALVGATGTAAHAVDASTDYTCAVAAPSVPLGTFNMAVSTPVIPASATAGQSFPGNLLSLTAVLTVPASSAAFLTAYNVQGGEIKDYAVGLGETDIKAPLTFDAPESQPDGSATMTGGGSNLPFTLPKAGTYKALLPSAFTFSTEVTPPGSTTPMPADINCTTTETDDLGSVEITKGVSQISSAKASKGKITVVVSRVGDDVVPTGKVTAKVGKKAYTGKLNKGKAVIKMPKTTKGKKATVSYKGDAYTAASDSVKVTVK